MYSLQVWLQFANVNFGKKRWRVSNVAIIRGYVTWVVMHAPSSSGKATQCH